MGIATLTLAVSGIFASEASKKFHIPKTIYYYQFGYYILSTACGSTTILTTNGSGHTLYISSSWSGKFYTIFYYSIIEFYPVQVNL